MTIQLFEQILFWCMIIHVGLMCLSLVLVTVCRPMVLRIHSKMFHVSEDYVARAMYAFLGIYKLLVFFFAIIPWIAMKIVGA